MAVPDRLPQPPPGPWSSGWTMSLPGGEGEVGGTPSLPGRGHGEPAGSSGAEGPGSHPRSEGWAV